MENNFISMPPQFEIHNGKWEKCDMLVGACSCGSWHKITDWKGKLKELDRYIKNNYEN